MRYRVIKSYRSAYPDPLCLRQGERLRCERRQSEWPGWVWCSDTSGREGWVPEGWVKVEGDHCVLQRDYDATELTVEVGEDLAGVFEESGWAWVRNAQGAEGWVPLDCLEERPSSTVEDKATETDTYIRQLALSEPLREVMLREAILLLDLSVASHGLDAGCGIGSHTLLLAGAVGPNGRVTGLDVSPAFLEYARSRADRAGLSDQVVFQQADLNAIPAVDDTFDWAWSVDCVGYPAATTQGMMRELVRVVKPGGKVAVLFWSSQQLLPGYPRLEARLNATAGGIAPFAEGTEPGLHSLRALGWMSKVGLAELTAHTLVGEVQAPLAGDIREALASLLDMRWRQAAVEIEPDERAEFHRLCDPASADFIPDRPDYYAFFTYSLFRGRVAG